jgi:hypothetical protein
MVNPERESRNGKVTPDDSDHSGNGIEKGAGVERAGHATVNAHHDARAHFSDHAPFPVEYERAIDVADVIALCIEDRVKNVGHDFRLLVSQLIPHRNRSRVELLSADEFQVDMLR